MKANFLKRLIRSWTWWAWKEEMEFKYQVSLLRHMNRFTVQPDNEAFEVMLLGPMKKRNRRMTWWSKFFPNTVEIKHRIQDMLCRELASLVINRPLYSPLLLRLWNGEQENGAYGWYTVMIERGYGELSNVEKIKLLEKKVEHLRKALILGASQMCDNPVKDKDDRTVVGVEG